MAQEHPNIALLRKLDLRNLDAARDLFTDDFVWHFINPKLPHIQGDYIGVDGLKRFFATLSAETGGTFRVEPVSVMPAGDELIVAHVRDTMELRKQAIVLDAVVVWRMVDGRLAEAWDIPSVHTSASPYMADDG